MAFWVMLSLLHPGMRKGMPLSSRNEVTCTRNERHEGRVAICRNFCSHIAQEIACRTIAEELQRGARSCEWGKSDSFDLGDALLSAPKNAERKVVLTQFLQPGGP